MGTLANYLNSRPKADSIGVSDKFPILKNGVINYILMSDLAISPQSVTVNNVSHVNGNITLTPQIIGSLPITGGQVGVGADNITIDKDGLVLSGTSTVFCDLLPTAVYTPTGASAPNITVYPGSTTLKCQEFTNAGGAEEFNPSFQFPHEWKEGTEIVPHLHLAIPDDGTGGTITMNMTYQWVNHDDIGAIAETTVSGSIIRLANAGVNHNAILSFPPITDATKKISSIFTARITRNTGDTFQGSVWLKSADIHVECNTLGSNTLYTK
jgi:hypothetical protein